MVYIGQWKGRPLVFHAPWGLHTFGDGGRDGRLVLGRVVVTSLRPGEEVPAVGPQHLLINRVRAMLTGFADLTAAIAAVNEGNIFRFLTKPCETSALQAALDAAVEQYRLVMAEQASTPPRRKRLTV